MAYLASKPVGLLAGLVSAQPMTAQPQGCQGVSRVPYSMCFFLKMWPCAGAGKVL